MVAVTLNQRLLDADLSGLISPMVLEGKVFLDR
jgi:hypothetical protein